MQMRNSNCAGRQLAHATTVLSSLITLLLLMGTATLHAQTLILDTDVVARPSLEQLVDNLIAKMQNVRRRCNVIKAGDFIVWTTPDSPPP